MATKKKRTDGKRPTTNHGQPRSYSEIYKGETTRPQPVSTVTRPVPTAPAVVENTDWTAEYQHVIGDLRLLLLVSAALFAIIIVTSFFI
jgi:hypothetical protein